MIQSTHNQEQSRGQAPVPVSSTSSLDSMTTSNFQSSSTTNTAIHTTIQERPPLQPNEAASSSEIHQVTSSQDNTNNSSAATSNHNTAPSTANTQYATQQQQKQITAVSTVSPRINPTSTLHLQPQPGQTPNTTAMTPTTITTTNIAPSSYRLHSSVGVTPMSITSAAVAAPAMLVPVPITSASSLPLPPQVTTMPTTAPTTTATTASNGTVVANNNTVAEFLYQLTKMLTDDNKEIIEWSNGKIEVHNPHKLASDVLHKYFRHSKFASFQRQLNYFGFRKLAGKGKMAPCSYVNDGATEDLRSLLLIKRKTSATTSRDRGSKKRDRSAAAAAFARTTTDPNLTTFAPSSSQCGMSASCGPTPPANPVLARILHKSINAAIGTTTKTSTVGPEAATVGTDDKRSRVDPLLSAKLAAGHGVRHPLNGYLRTGEASSGSTIAAATAIAPAPPLAATTTAPSSAILTNGTTNSNASSQSALAQSAVGKGVKHGYSGLITTGASLTPPTTGPTTLGPSTTTATATTNAAPAPTFTFKDPHQLGMDIHSSLSELSYNFRNSLVGNEGQQQQASAMGKSTHPSSLTTTTAAAGTSAVSPNALSPSPAAPTSFGSAFGSGGNVSGGGGGYLGSNSSLIDLAMIPPVEENTTVTTATTTTEPSSTAISGLPTLATDSANVEMTEPLFMFVDFPHEELNPMNQKGCTG